jgi:hypothetical protein
VTEARAAVTGHKVRYVLAFSLIGMSRLHRHLFSVFWLNASHYTTGASPPKNETPKKRWPAYIRCMLIERLRNRLASTGAVKST